MPRTALKPGQHGNIALTPIKRTGAKRTRLTIVGKAYLLPDGTRTKPDLWAASTNLCDRDGTMRKVKRDGANREEARQNLMDALGSRHAPTAADIKPGTTVAALAALWLAHTIKRGQVSTGTVKMYRNAVVKHVAPRGSWNGEGDKPKPSAVENLTVEQVNAGNVHDFLHGLINAETGAGRGTTKTVRTVLHGMFALAVRNEAVSINPVRQAERVGAPSKVVRALDTARKGHLTAGERAAIKEAASADVFAHRDLADLVCFLDAVAPRLGEALALRWDDVDLTAGVVTIGGHTVVRVKGAGLVREAHGATKDFEREVTLTADLTARLMARMVASTSEYVFPTPGRGKSRHGAGTLRDVSNTIKELRQVFDAAGVDMPKGQGSHLFRHSLVTDLIQAGVPTREVSNAVGHRATKTTTDTYASTKVRAGAAALIR